MLNKGRVVVVSIGLSAALFPISCCATFTMRGKSSYIKVASGATLVLDQPIGGFKGKLIRETGGVITGSSGVTFSDGLFEDAGNSIQVQGFVVPATSMAMTGNKTVRSNPGKVLQPISVSGTGNRLEGQPTLTNPITLSNAGSALTLAIESTLTKNVVLNSGTLALDNDLHLADTVLFTGPGIVQVNGYRVVLGGKNFTWPTQTSWQNATDLELNSTVTLSSNWSFSGTSRINGNGNILDISSGGTLTVEPGSQLYLTDVVLKGLGASGSIIFQSSASELYLSNATLELTSNITTTLGKVYAEGPATVVVKGYTWTFNTDSLLTINGVTLWKDQAGQSTGTIAFGSPQSTYLSLLNDGALKTIGDISSTAGPLQSQIDVLSTSTTSLQTQINSNGALISALQTSTGSLQTQINSSSILVSQLQTSTIALQSQINNSDALISSLQTSTELLQSQLDVCCSANGSVIDLLISDTGKLESLIDTIEALDLEQLKSSTAALQSQLDICCQNTSFMIDQLGTSTSNLQLQINELEMGTTYSYQVVIADLTVLSARAVLEAGLILEDAMTTHTLGLLFPVTGTIDLNGGTLNLTKDLFLNNEASIVGGGLIKGNGHVINLAPSVTTLGPVVFEDLTLVLHGDLAITDTISVKGTCVINGNNHMLDLAAGSLELADGATLYLNNVEMSGIGGTNIHCSDDVGAIHFSNVVWEQESDYTFDQGLFTVKGELMMRGQNTIFAYRSGQTSTVLARGHMLLDQGFTFSYDPTIASQQLLAFEDGTSMLSLECATLHTTTTGLQLRKGTLVVHNKATLFAETTDGMFDGGITLGDGVDAGNDMCVVINCDGALALALGVLNYKNVELLSWKMLSKNSILRLNDATKLALFRSLDTGIGFLYCGASVVLERVDGSELLGSVQAEGPITCIYTN